MSDAATAENMSQPALASGLAKIEGALGASLFVRTSHTMVVSEAGEICNTRVQRGILLLLSASRASGRENLYKVVTLRQAEQFDPF
jgi:DNA-binding transcriptional LysR family regulator